MKLMFHEVHANMKNISKALISAIVATIPPLTVRHQIVSGRYGFGSSSQQIRCEMQINRYKNLKVSTTVIYFAHGECNETTVN